MLYIQIHRKTYHKMKMKTKIKIKSNHITILKIVQTIIQKPLEEKNYSYNIFARSFQIYSIVQLIYR